MIHLQKGINIGHGSGGGIKSGAWVTLRAVSLGPMTFTTTSR